MLYMIFSMSRTGSNPADINRFGSHTVKVNKFFNSFKVAALVAYRGVVKKTFGSPYVSRHLGAKKLVLIL